MELFEDPEVLNSQQKIKGILSAVSIKEFVKTILKACPKRFFCIFFLIMLPLSFLQLFLETNNLALAIVIGDISYGESPAESLLPYKQIVSAYSSVNLYLKLNSIQFCAYLILFFIFYLLSVSVMTITVASLYLSKPLSYVSILYGIPRILRRLAITFLHALPLILLNYIAYLVVFTLLCTILTLICTIPKINHVLVVVIGIVFCIIYLFFILFVQARRFIAWLNFANVISVVEPNIYGLEAIKKGKQFLNEEKINWRLLATIYLGTVYEIVCFGNFVMSHEMNMKERVLIGSLFVMALAVVNLLGLTVQNLMYYKNQVIDKGVLNENVSEMKGSVSIKMEVVVRNDNNLVGSSQLEV